MVHLRISFLEALLGFDREIQHLDGHLVRIFVRRGTVVQPDEVLVIEGEGMSLGHAWLHSFQRLDKNNSDKFAIDKICNRVEYELIVLVVTMYASSYIHIY